MEKEFTEWFEANEKKFANGQFDENQIAYSAYLEGKNKALSMSGVSKRDEKILYWAKNLEHKSLSIHELVQQAKWLLSHVG